MLNRHRKSLIYYWTTRFFLILMVSMFIIGGSTIYFVQIYTEKSQHEGLELIVRDLSKVAAEHGGKLPGGPEMGRFLDDKASLYELKDRPIMLILDQSREIVQTFPPIPPHSAMQFVSEFPEHLAEGLHIFTLEPEEGREPLIVGVHSITNQSAISGYVVYGVHKENMFKGIVEYRPPRFIFVVSSLIISWFIIYMLTRRLVKPIQEVADAAKQVVAGNYNLQVDHNHREREIHELLLSFKEMADRLDRLESLRKQLLAGVTHELRTPITSISGLIQAVKDKVVKGEEADEFLAVCLNESNRLQKIVEDLLDFNSFASGSITTIKEMIELDIAIRSMVERWQIGQEQDQIEVAIEIENDGIDWRTLTDSNRLEQIIINLLNNARDAMDTKGFVRVKLAANSGEFQIQVEDTGRGLTDEEQLDVFEPFYRGQEKKSRIQGLGIGLPFSRLIAKSLGGELVLTNTSSSGTTFTISIPNNILQ